MRQQLLFFGVLGTLTSLGCAPNEPAKAPEPEKAAQSSTTEQAPSEKAPSEQAPVEAATRAEPPATPPESAEGIVTITSPCGLYLLGNTQSGHFQALLAGKEIGLPDQNKTRQWVIDDVLVEVQVASAELMKAPTLRSQPLLDHHREWELAWAAKQNNWPVPEATVFHADAARPGSKIEVEVWAFKPPKLEVMGFPISVVSYATAAVDDVVVAVSAPSRAEDNPDSVLRVLKSLADTITFENGPMNPPALAERVKLQAAADPTCSQGPRASQ